jgi:hypothetical protein
MKKEQAMDLENQVVLRKMKTRIDQLEKLALELKELGHGVPAVEKNSRNILSAVFNLKFGVSDVADIETS